MKVLVVSQHFWPESFRITEVAQSLLEQGCEVTVLTGKPNYPDGQIFANYSAAGLQQEQHEGVRIVRVPLIPRGQGGRARLIANYLSFISSATVLGPWALRGQHFDIIFVYASSPILQAIAAIALKRIKRSPLVIWVQDLWPDSLQVTGYVRNRTVLSAVAAVVRWIYRRSDLLLVQSRAFIAPVQAMAGGTPVVYHPNPGDRTRVATENARETPALQLKHGFNIVFAGNLGTVQALDTVLAAAEELGPDSVIRWVLVGSGTRHAWLAKEVRRRGLNTVELPGRLEPRDMAAIFSQADALLVSLVRGEAMSQTIPSKVQAYLSTGRPVIAALDGEGARVVEEAGAGLICRAEDTAGLIEAARRLQAMTPAERSRMGEAGRRYYQQHFAPDVLAQSLVTQFRRIIGIEQPRG